MQTASPFCVDNIFHPFQELFLASMVYLKINICVQFQVLQEVDIIEDIAILLRALRQTYLRQDQQRIYLGLVLPMRVHILEGVGFHLDHLQNGGLLPTGEVPDQVSFKSCKYYTYIYYTTQNEYTILIESLFNSNFRISSFSGSCNRQLRGLL